MDGLTVKGSLSLVLEQVDKAARKALAHPLAEASGEFRSAVRTAASAAAQGDVIVCVRQYERICKFLGDVRDGKIRFEDLPPGVVIDDENPAYGLMLAGLTAALENLNWESRLVSMLVAGNVFAKNDMPYLFGAGGAMEALAAKNYVEDVTEERHAREDDGGFLADFLPPAEPNGKREPNPDKTAENIRYLKHVRSQCVFAIETDSNGNGHLFEVDPDTKLVKRDVPHPQP